MLTLFALFLRLPSPTTNENRIYPSKDYDTRIFGHVWLQAAVKARLGCVDVGSDSLSLIYMRKSTLLMFWRWISCLISDCLLAGSVTFGVFCVNYKTQLLERCGSQFNSIRHDQMWIIRLIHTHMWD